MLRLYECLLWCLCIGCQPNINTTQLNIHRQAPAKTLKFESEQRKNRFHFNSIHFLLQYNNSNEMRKDKFVQAI